MCIVVVFLIERRDCNHICLETCCHTNLITGFPLSNQCSVPTRDHLQFCGNVMEPNNNPGTRAKVESSVEICPLGKKAEKNDNLSSSHVILFLCIQVGGVLLQHPIFFFVLLLLPQNNFSHTRKNKEWGHARMLRKPLLFKRPRR